MPKELDALEAAHADIQNGANSSHIETTEQIQTESTSAESAATKTNTNNDNGSGAKEEYSSDGGFVYGGSSGKGSGGLGNNRSNGSSNGSITGIQEL